MARIAAGIARLVAALDGAVVAGPKNNVAFLGNLLRTPEFKPARSTPI